MDEMPPLVGLAGHEDGPAQGGEKEEDLTPPPVAVAEPLQSLHHGHAGADQEEGHSCGQVDAQHVKGNGPVSATGPGSPVSSEKGAKANGVADEKGPHAELAPALRGER